MNTTITNPVILILLITGCFLGITLGFFLLFNKSAKNSANLYLGILVFLITSFFIPGFLLRFDLLDDFTFVIGTHRVIHFLIGPLAYFYVRACTQKDFKMHPLLWLHFIPLALDILFNIPTFTQSSAEKLAEYHTFILEGDFVQSEWMQLAKAIHVTCYFSISCHLIFLYQKHLSNSASFIDNAFHRWLLVFIIMLLLPIAGLLGYTIFEYQRIIMVIALFSFFIFLLMVYFGALTKPELFHSFPHQMLIPESTEDRKQKYESSNLQAEKKKKYVEKLLAFMDVEKSFLEPELTLSDLSEQVQIPAHYLSQVINEKMNCNFLDFVNGYRVKEAQAKLVDAKYSHYTIISIAYEAGFNSKSTFYTAFKKQTGQTPSQYRKSFVGREVS